jgi:hypothetical protein
LLRIFCISTGIKSMSKAISEVVVFDRDHGLLERLSVEAGARKIETRDSAEAVAELLNCSWKVAFVHIKQKPWESLCKETEAISGKHALVRFSSQGFPPMPPQRRALLILHCLKKTFRLRQSDIVSLIDVLTELKSVGALRNGLIPPSVQDLIAFEQPHSLRALHILMLGVLAYWASDPEHPRRRDASNLLRLSYIPRLPQRDFTQMENLWRGLGLDITEDVDDRSKKDFRNNVSRELGIRALDQRPDVKALVNYILESKRDEHIEASQSVLDGFAAIDDFLRR